MISSYSGSFQSLWENINILVDKVNKLEEKDVFYSELGEIGSKIMDLFYTKNLIRFCE